MNCYATLVGQKEMEHTPHAVYLVDFENSEQSFVSLQMPKPADIAVYVFYNPRHSENAGVEKWPSWVVRVRSRRGGWNASDDELFEFGSKYLLNHSPVHLCVVYQDDKGYRKIVESWRRSYPGVNVRKVHALTSPLNSLYHPDRERCPFCAEQEEEYKWESPLRHQPQRVKKREWEGLQVSEDDLDTLLKVGGAMALVGGGLWLAHQFLSSPPPSPPASVPARASG